MTTSIRATLGPSSSSAPPGAGPGRRFWGLPLSGRSGGAAAAAPAQEILERFLVEVDAFIPEEKARMGEGCAAIYRLEEIRDHREYVNEEETIMLCVEGSGFDHHQLRSTVKGEAAYRTLCEETQTRFIEMQQGLSSRIHDLEAEKIVLLERVEELEDALRRSMQKKDDVEEPLRNGFVTTRRTPPMEQRAFHPPPRRNKAAKKPPGEISGNQHPRTANSLLDYRPSNTSSRILSSGFNLINVSTRTQGGLTPRTREGIKGPGGSGEVPQTMRRSNPVHLGGDNNNSSSSSQHWTASFGSATGVGFIAGQQQQQQQQSRGGGGGGGGGLRGSTGIPLSMMMSEFWSIDDHLSSSSGPISILLHRTATTTPSALPTSSVLTTNRAVRCPLMIFHNGFSLLLLVSLSSLVTAFEYPDPQHDPERCGLSTPGWICDPDRYLSRDEINFLDQELRKGFAVDSECGPYQLAVAISRNTWPVGGVERFARSIHNAWGVGHAPCDSGVVMALDIGNREMFISTGKAANDRMSTSSASVIIDRMRPFMREYKYAEGIFEGVKLIRQVVDTGEQLSGITFPLILFFTLFFGIWGCVIFFFIKGCLQNRRTSAVRRQLGRMEKERAEALQGHFRQTSCPICLEDFIELHHPSSDKKNDESAEQQQQQQAPLITGQQECELLRCGHKFHKGCLQEWQEQGIHRHTRDGLRCPVCRKDVNKDEDSDDEHDGGGPNGGGKRVSSSSSSTGLGGGMTYVGPFYPGYEYGPLWDFQMMRLRHQYPGIVTVGFVQQYSWTSLGTGTSSCPMPSQDRSINPPPPSSHQGGGGSGFGGSNFGGGGASGGGAGGSW
ncbi:hypothetical protein FOZ61_008757 [Perkinsus olseni]|uniref:RING-type domain-containing protein n=1 Tax=Perkinsus olseni TaxID=32597 RepID=A0A7J6L4F2_PEROL|nr:hypothetical protein FOZ61_008757 [Perkinsus olseni]